MPRGVNRRDTQWVEFKRPVPVTGDLTATVGDINISSGQFYEYPSRINGWSSSQLSAGASQTFAGTPAGTEVQRRAFQISNLDPNSRIDLLDESDNFVLAVFPETSITLPVSSAIKIKNNSAATITLYASEIFYTQPS